MATEENGSTPINIIKKKKRSGQDSHGGAWKVAYADFVTAMMALFIVLWIIGQSKQVKQYVAEYFKDPVHSVRKPGTAPCQVDLFRGERQLFKNRGSLG